MNMQKDSPQNGRSEKLTRVDQFFTHIKMLYGKKMDTLYSTPDELALAKKFFGPDIDDLTDQQIQLGLKDLRNHRKGYSPVHGKEWDWPDMPKIIGLCEASVEKRRDAIAMDEMNRISQIQSDKDEIEHIKYRARIDRQVYQISTDVDAKIQEVLDRGNIAIGDIDR